MPNRACITNNCGNLSFYFCENREYDHPLMACLFVIDELFVKLCENFDYYMSVTPKIAPPSRDSIWARQNGDVWYKHKEIRIGYPVMYLEDIEIHWIHEDTAEEMLSKYNRRRERYLTNKPETMFFWSDGDMMNDHEPQKYNNLVYRFTSLPNSIFITRYTKIARFYKNTHIMTDWINGPTDRNESFQLMVNFINDRVNAFKEAYAKYPPEENIKSIEKRDKTQIANEYFLRGCGDGDFTCNVFFVDEHECCVSIIRHDEDTGWENGFDVVVENETLHIPPSRDSFTRILFITKTSLIPVSDVPQCIPKVIVQTNEENIYKNRYAFLSQKSILEANPEYEYAYFNSHDRRSWLRENFDDDVVFAYDMLVAGAFQADLFRIAYLLKRGGCYIDFKMIARFPLRKIIEQNDDLVMCCDYERSNSMDREQSKSYLNALIFVKPNSDKMQRVLQACVRKILYGRREFEEEMTQGGCSKILSVSGPCLFYEILQNSLSDDQLKLKHIIEKNDESYYKNFRIMSLKTGECVFTKTHRNYVRDTKYDELWFRREIFYTNAAKVGDIFVFVYPHRYNDTFSFYITNDGCLSILRHQGEGWGMNLRLKIVNNITSRMIDVNVGNSKDHVKTIRLNYAQNNDKPKNVC